LVAPAPHPTPVADFSQRCPGSSGSLHRDAEQPLAVISSAVESVSIGKGLAEELEAPVTVEIVRHGGAARSQCRPCLLDLPARVPSRMPAVVEEELHLSAPLQQAGQAPAARAFDVGPPPA